MSTFSGCFKEDVFKDIIVDKFLLVDKSKAYFLSHYHTDHMDGLHGFTFVRMFQENPTTYMYCSTITKKLMMKDSFWSAFRIPENQIVELDTEEIYLSLNGVAVKVTPLRAGHCPGSLMFMFEACDTKILYTGDFRYNESDLLRCPHYLEDNQFFSNIETLYLDTTFATPEFETFPTRDESYDSIRQIIKMNWNDFNYVVIYQPARIGQEYLIPLLHRDFKVKIHFSCRNLQRTVSCIEQLKDFVTERLKDSKIHICGNKQYKSCDNEDCPLSESNKSSQPCMTILPSAFKFNEKVTNEKSTSYMDGSCWRVAYSSHSSLREIAEFVKFINPKAIKPCALPNRTTEEEIIDNIQSYIRRYL